MPKNRRYENAAPLWASQNFLTSERVIVRLLNLSHIASEDRVLEIGPGKGHITRRLLERCGQVTAVEIDPALCAGLRERFAGESRLCLRQGDFLRTPLPKGPYKVFANIPFSLTTPIIRRLTTASNPPRGIWLVVELGAAKRFAGQPRETLTSLSLRPFFQVRIAAAIPRREFHPSPHADAALLEILPRQKPDLPLKEREAYQKFLQRGWNQGPESLLTKRQISTALRLAGLPQPGIDRNMKYVQWLCLFRCWRERGR